MSRLAIVIVNFNTRAELSRCLDSLISQPPTTPHDIVVVDNASTDDSVGIVRARWPSVRIIEAGANLGFARANNLGIRATASELVLLLNSDTVVPPGTIDTLVRWLDTHPGAAVVGPRLVDAHGRAELSWGWMVSPWHELRQKLLTRGHDRGVGLLSRRVERLTRRERRVDWVSGACLLARRAAAEHAGLLDERYFMYLEDVDFCAAIRAHGGDIVFMPTAEVVHLRGRSRAKAPQATDAAYRRSHVAFYEKHHPLWAPLLRVYLRVRGQRTMDEN